LSRLLLGLAVLFIALALAFILLPQHAQAGGSGVYPPPTSGDWVISTDTVVFSESVKIKGNIVVQPGKDLNLDHVTLVMNGSVPDQFRIEVQNNGSLDIRTSTITTGNKSVPYFMVVKKDGALTVVNSTLEYMGLQDASSIDQYGLTVHSSHVSITGSVIKHNWIGIYIDHVNPTVSGNNFTGNYRGIWSHGSSLLLITGNTFYDDDVGVISEGSTMMVQGCQFLKDYSMGLEIIDSTIDIEASSVKASNWYGIGAWNSSIFMANGTLDSKFHDVYLDKNSSMWAYNVSMNILKLNIEDELSHITAYYCVDVKVVWWSSSGPVKGAFVRLTGPDGAEVANGTTKQNGVLQGLWVLGFDRGYRGFVFYSPINLTARASGLKGNSTVDLKGSGLVNVTIDDLLPGLNVTAPRSNSYNNKRDMTIQGVLWDNESGPSRVEVSVDGGNFTTAHGVDLWNLTVTVNDGAHNITVRGWDVAGNSRTIKFNFTVDSLPPAVTIKGPKNGSRTRLTRIWVNGTVEMGANLTIGGRRINDTDGNWGLYVDLVEGANNITAEARDRAGNIGRTFVIVTRDTKVDPLVVDPVNGTSTNIKNLTLKGTTEPGVFLRATWDLVVGSGNNTTVIHRNVTAVADQKGSFSLMLELKEGVNNITLFAKDTLNNTRYMNLTYKLDSIPPVLVITSPRPNPYYTNKNGVNIKGYTEVGARVFLNGQELQLYDLQFTIRVEIFDGINNFTVKAVDPAGNEVTIVLNVNVDKIPPALNITKPSDPVTKTYDAYYTVTGNTENGSTVFINGVAYTVGPGGGFMAKRSLAFGRNDLVITSKDRAGNSRTVERTIVREKPPPNMIMTYIGYLIPLLILALIIAIVLFYMYGTGRFQGLKDRVGQRKEAKEKDRLAEEDGKEAPSREPKEAEGPITIPGTSEGPSYDDEDKDDGAKADEDVVEEMEEIDDKEGKE
jgi:parallel beta-helix repeat protein